MLRSSRQATNRGPQHTRAPDMCVHRIRMCVPLSATPYESCADCPQILDTPNAVSEHIDTSYVSCLSGTVTPHPRSRAAVWYAGASGRQRERLLSVVAYFSHVVPTPCRPKQMMSLFLRLYMQRPTPFTHYCSACCVSMAGCSYGGMTGRPSTYAGRLRTGTAMDENIRMSCGVLLWYAAVFRRVRTELSSFNTKTWS